MTYEEARAFAAAGELRNRMKRDPALAIKITEKAIVERDRLKAINAELLAALETLVRGRPTTPPNHAVLGKDSVAYMNWLAFEAARAAIAKARGE